MVSAIWEAEKAMLVRFNPKTDLHVEAVKYDLRLSRANITYHCCFPAHPNSSDSLVRILLQTLIKVVINKHFPLGCSNLELKPVAATSKKLYLKCNIAIITTGNKYIYLWDRSWFGASFSCLILSRKPETKLCCCISVCSPLWSSHLH